jgi:outer membrane protein
MEQLRESVEAAGKGLRAALTSNFPAFYLNGNYGLEGKEFPPTATSWAYGMSVSWPMFDVGQTRGLIQQARANLASAQASVVQGEQSVAAEVVQDYLNVQAAEQQVAASATDVAKAQENLRVALGSYQAGVVPYINVTEAQTALVTAETSQVNARYSLSMARAALARALGMAGH